MKNKTFMDEFNVSILNNEFKNISDYKTFKNKELLDNLRNKIIQNLIDNKIDNQPDMNSFIKTQIDKTLEFNR